MAKRVAFVLVVVMVGAISIRAFAVEVPHDVAGGHGAEALAHGVETTAHGVEAGDHAAADEQPSLLTPDLGSAVWSIVLFVVLLFVLSKYVWPPILKGLQEREGKIRADLEHAEASARQAEQTLREYQARLSAAQQEAQQVIERSREDARKLADQLRQRTEEDINQLRQRAEGELTNAKQRAINELYAEAGLIATHIAGRILQRELSPEDQKRLIDETLDEFTRTRRG